MASKVVGNLIVNLAANVADFRSDMKKAATTSQRQMKKIERQTAQMKRKIKNSLDGVGAAFAALGVGMAVRGVINATAEYERLGAALITVEGSQKAANAQFKILEKFAAKTPFQLQEVVDGYIKLKARGLDPSIKSMTAFGNVAGAMGKTLDQFIEAVGDAATGEMERLKEFGIVARQQGDKVKFTFQGITTEVGRNAREIVGYLRNLGETKFAGGMERQANTLGGAISNLQDAVFSLSSSGDVDGLKSSIRGLSATLNDPATREGIQSFVNGLIKLAEWSAKALSAFAAFGKGIGSTLAEMQGFRSGSQIDVVSGQIERLNRQLTVLKVAEVGILDNLFGKAGDIAAQKEQLKARIDNLTDYRDELIKKSTQFDFGEYTAWLDKIMAEAEAVDTVSQAYLDATTATATVTFNAEQQKTLALFDKYQPAAQKIAVLKSELLDAARAGKISQETFQNGIAALNQQLEDLKDKAPEAFDFMAAAAEGAAQSMQSHLADFFMDFDGGMKGMVKGFIDSMRRMVAEMLAFQVLKNTIGKIPGFSAAFAPAHAAIGGLASGPTIVGEHGPELVNLPAMSKVTPNSKIGSGITINMPVDARYVQSPAQMMAMMGQFEGKIYNNVARMMQGHAPA